MNETNIPEGLDGHETTDVGDVPSSADVDEGESTDVDEGGTSTGVDPPERGAERRGADGASSGLGPRFDRRTFLKLAGAGAFYTGVAGSEPVHAQSGHWTIVALPDTQKYAKSSTLITYAQDQTDWVVNNLDAENVAFVTHEGDIVDDGSNQTQWERMDAIVDTLDGDLSTTPDGLVPYATPPGDHDWAVEEDRSSSTAYYRQYFGQSRYEGRSWFGGAAPNDLSHYQLFSAGGYDFLHIDLEWEAPGDASDASTPLGWAQSVMDQYSDRPTIVTTHSYVWDGNPPGRTTFVEENSGDGSSGQEIWKAIIEPNPQVFMVLNGNFHESSGSDNGEYHQVSTNAAGRSVYEILANYQDYPNGGNGWLRLVQFVPGGGSDGQDRIAVRTYSPSLDQFATDSSSQFGFDLDFASRFSGPDSTTETVTFQQGTDGYAGTVDTYLQEDSPSANNASATTLNVDSDDPNGTNRDVHALVRFENVVGADSGQVPVGTTVTSATLTVQTTNNGDGASLHRMLTAWTDTDTWETFGGDGIQADGVEAATSTDVTTGTVIEEPTPIDVTASVQAWVDGQTNLGWVFLPSGDNGWDFYSAEGATPPRLDVTYEAESGDGDASVAVTTESPSAVGETTATLEGTLTDLGGAASADVSFEYRKVGASNWATTATQTLSATGSFSESVDGLTDGVEYEYRAVATASDGDTATGSVVTFTTTDDPPAVTTGSATNVGETTATLEGSLDDLGNAASADVGFEYREVGASSWSGTTPQTLSATGGFSTAVDGLASGTDYEFRAVVDASDGDTATGSSVPFTTTESTNHPPAIDDYTVTELGSPNPHAEIIADWAVSDADGNLRRVMVEVVDSGGQTVGRSETSVGGTSATGRDEFKIKHVRGERFDVTLTVTDSDGATANATQSVRE
ncbi:DNRLRE domain-containing protein [Haloferax sp. S1W]|uniref:DNRLRE domain-containing protein n=1 Tax=Haloferax sp. S1W TaxID=3377110 RepID=UPI0037C73474